MKMRERYRWLRGCFAGAVLAIVLGSGNAARAQQNAPPSSAAPADEHPVAVADVKEKARKADASWLAQVDARDYAMSWTIASPDFKAAVPESKWVSAVEGVRAPLGKVLHRELASATYSTHLPGAKDGEYVVTQYKTSFEHKADAVETVVAQRDADGSWRVSGYFVK